MDTQRRRGIVAVVDTVEEESGAFDCGEIEVDEERLDQIVVIGLLDVQRWPRTHLAKDIFDALEEASIFVLVARCRLELLFRQRLCELFEDFPLVLRQLPRRDHLHRDEQVAAATTGHDVGHAFPAQAECCAGLRPLRDLQRLLALEARNGDFTAERERRVVERNFAEQIVTVAMEERMLLYMDDDVEVAGGATAAARFTLAAEAQPLSARDARGNLDGQLPGLLHATGSAARRARRTDDRPSSTALPAGSSNREEPLLIPQLTTAMTLRAGGRLRAGRSSRAVTRLARLLPRDLDRGLDTTGRFVERDLEVVAQIRATLRPSASALAAEHLANPEDVAETAQDVFKACEDRRIETAGRGAAKPGMPEAVVDMPFVGGGEHGIGFGRFLELLFGDLVAGIAIGMVLERELAIRALDFLVGGRPRNAEYLVVVAFAHAFATLTIAGRRRRFPSM